MARLIEDYALIGDCRTAALVAKDGSLDWLCLPRFDSPAAFAAILGTPDHGRWLLAPSAEPKRTARSYRGDTLILETLYETDEGAAVVVDCMPIKDGSADVLRMVEGLRGTVRFRMEFRPKFDYGSATPWVRAEGDDGVVAVCGPETLHLLSPVPLSVDEWEASAEFEVGEGDKRPFVLTWHPSHLPIEEPIEPHAAIASTVAWWEEWSGRCEYRGPYREAVVRSLITLKALTYQPTGGIVAAPTTSLPEEIGGVRNWDYRYCWLRDATFTLTALLQSGYREEADAWRQWLVRAVAGKGDEAHIMYGLAGERRLPEMELPWLPGFEGSKPVRIGNGAYDQFQLDIYGEVMASLHLARHHGLSAEADDWRIERELMQRLEEVWQDPDEGIWEVRGGSRHFTHSKLMAWLAFDRAIKDADEFGLEGPIDRWKSLRDRLHAEICERAFSKDRNAFTQSYDSEDLDASVLVMMEVGFLPPDDPRLVSTVEAIEKELMRGDFVERYRSDSGIDGLEGSEGTFLLCTFWLADNYVLMGRLDDARRIFESVLAVRNDVGLLAEEYDAKARRQLGNFPQAFSHLGLVNTAWHLDRAGREGTSKPLD
jgi:GH15 family glucan-1,4-alpha-glucosidase